MAESGPSQYSRRNTRKLTELSTKYIGNILRITLGTAAPGNRFNKNGMELRTSKNINEMTKKERDENKIMVYFI